MRRFSRFDWEKIAKIDGPFMLKTVVPYKFIHSEKNDQKVESPTEANAEKIKHLCRSEMSSLFLILTFCPLSSLP